MDMSALTGLLIVWRSRVICAVSLNLPNVLGTYLHFVPTDVPFLPLQVPQSIQKEEKSSQSEVDKGLQEVPWQRAHSGMLVCGM